MSTHFYSVALTREGDTFYCTSLLTCSCAMFASSTAAAASASSSRSEPASPSGPVSLPGLAARLRELLAFRSLHRSHAQVGGPITVALHSAMQL